MSFRSSLPKPGAPTSRTISLMIIVGSCCELTIVESVLTGLIVSMGGVDGFFLSLLTL